MSIITISRGSNSRGREIAERVAEELGYECIARKALHEASEEYHIPEVKLVRAIHDAPSILDRFVGGKARYIAYIQSVLANHFKQDNVVYHGLAGHFFLSGIPHVMKIRINADMDFRVGVVQKRDKVTAEEALHTIQRDDAERKRWSEIVYGIDQNDSHLYDLTIKIHKITVDHAVAAICQMARAEEFQATPESQQAMEDLALAAAVRSHLIGIKPDIEVTASKGKVMVSTHVYAIYRDALSREVRSLALEVEGVKQVEVELESTPRFS